MKILLAVDGSPYSVRAVETLRSHFQWFRDAPTLHLLHVHAEVPSPRARAVVGSEILEAYYREESEAALAVAKSPLDAAGIRYEAAFVVGEIGAEVARYVERHGVDLVCLGTHGHSDLKKVFMGSAATKIVAAVTVPVMLIK
jgi:nucleotide-binding universal stress UspA family protein